VTNPLLAEINGLSPGAKAALMQAHQAVAPQPQPLVPNSAASQLPPSVGPKAPMPDNGPPPTPAGLAPPNSGPMPAAIATPGPSEQPKSVIAPPGTIPADTADLARKESTGSGISQIHGMIENSRLGQAHPLLGKILGWGAQIPAELGDIAGSAVAPQVTRLIPGTEYHHDMLVNQGQKQVGQDVANAEKEAQTADYQAKPELEQAQLDLKTEHEHGQQQHQSDVLDATLRAHGYKHDEQGNVVPLEYGEMSPQQQAVTDLKGAQEEAQKAQADLRTAQKNNIPTQIAMAQQRLQTAQQNANTAIGRLGLQRDEYKANFLGTDANDQALPGAPTDQATGKPMGVRVANAGTPSADRLKRGDLANNVLENTQQIRSLITQNPNLFGAVAGHFTTTQQMIGSDNPAIAELGVRIHNAALASNGAHGLRSQEAVAQTEQMLLNHFRNSPKATIAGLDALDDSVKTFIDAANQGKRAQPTSDVMKLETSGKAVSLKAAMGLPAMKGKSEAEVRQAIKAAGHQVVE
jgi:hypothetical protein